MKVLGTPLGSPEFVRARLLEFSGTRFRTYLICSRRGCFRHSARLRARITSHGWRWNFRPRVPWFHVGKIGRNSDLRGLLPFVKTVNSSASLYVWVDAEGRHTIEQHERATPIIPSLFSLGIHLAEVRQSLEDGECLFVFVDDIHVSS